MRQVCERRRSSSLQTVGCGGLEITSGPTKLWEIAAVTQLVASYSPVGPPYSAQWWLAGARIVITAAAVCAVAVAIVTTVLTRRRLVRAASVRSVLSLDGPLTGAGLRDALRTLTSDPSLEVYFRLPGRSEYVTSVGEPKPWTSEEGKGSSRQLIGAGVSDGTGYSVLVDAVVSATRSARAKRREVLEAATPALENARLQATLRYQVLELTASRARTLRAFLAERSRLEGQLHDGTQACMFEARSQIRRARSSVSHPLAVASIGSAGAVLDNAITELGTLVRGIYPAGLRESGLGNALFVATTDMPLAVEITDDAADRLDEITATAGFFAVMDILYLAVRAHARSATIQISTDGGVADITIKYMLAAQPGPTVLLPEEGDAWLAAQDRIQAMDGTMQIINADSVRIVVVELPCAS